MQAYKKKINLWDKEAQQDSEIMAASEAHFKLGNMEKQTGLIITNDKVS